MVLNRVAVTGASGMIGRHLIPLLINKGIPFIATSRRRPAFIPQDSSWFQWDICQWKDTDELDHLFNGCNALIHLGAFVPYSSKILRESYLFDVNVRACLCLSLWSLKKNIPMIFLSSATVYDNPYQLNIKETDKKMSFAHGGFYGFSKILAENILQTLEVSGLKYCVLRPSSTYGTGLPEDKMIMSFLRRASNDMVIELVPPVEDKIDLIHAYDVAQAIIQVLVKNVTGTYNIASESPKTVLEIVEACVQVVRKGSVEILKNGIDRPPIVRFALCCDAAKKAFGFSPKLDLIDGIKKTWEDIKEH